MAEHHTKEYHRQKSREHYLRHKESYGTRSKSRRDVTVQIMLHAKRDGCILCGEMEPACLDFHHLGGKDRTVSQMRGMSDERVLDEIAKCVVVCSNCHRKIHAGIITSM